MVRHNTACSSSSISSPSNAHASDISPIPTACPHLSVMPSRRCNDSQTEPLVTASYCTKSEHFPVEQPQQWVSELQIPKLLLLVTGR